MAKSQYQIDIDGYIGDWYYSKAFVRNELSKYPNSQVMVRMNSLGGSLDHGLDICDRFGEHGDVQIDMFGMNASSATLATLKAKKVRMSSSGLYLIHKVMNWVDIWGSLNADQIAEEIQKLQDNKKENDKIDLVIAQMYADKTGKPISEMLQLMKVGGWLTAQEALDYGFIDEIIKSNEKINYKQMGEKLNAFGLPTNMIGKSNLFSNIKNSFPMKKQPLKINSVLGVQSLENEESEGVYFNEEQVHKIDARMAELENQVNTLTTEKENAVTAQQKAEGEKTEAEGKLTTANNTIEEQKTQIENLKKGPGASTKQTTQETDEDDNDDKGGDEFSNRVKKATELFNMIPDDL